MSHLKYGAGDSLLYGPTGHMVYDCGVQNACNACDPPIPDTLYVTFSGLGGSFASWNGKHALDWSTGCAWYGSGNGPPDLIHSAGIWTVNCYGGPGASCYKTWTKADAGGCTPEGGSYAESGCLSGGCPDVTSCANSAGATCVVSTS